MKTADETLPKGQEMNDGGCGDFTDMIDRQDGIDGIVEHTKEAIDEIINMYVEDGNPRIWLQKIVAFKETIK